MDARREWLFAFAGAAALSAWGDAGAWRFAFGGGFDARSAATIARFLILPVLGVAVFLASCALAGRAVLSFAGAGDDDELVGPLLSAAAGLAAACALVFWAGWAGFYGPAGLSAAAAALLALAALGLKGARPRAISLPRLGPGETVLAALLLYAGWHALARACAPVTDWDALAYHLALPKIYWRLDGVVELPWLVHAHWPHAMELLYGAALALRIDGAAALLHAALCAAWIGLAAVAARRWGEGDGWTAAAVLAGQPAVLSLSGVPHGDGAWAFFHLAACAALWRRRETGREGWSVVAGLCAGAGASCKLLGALAFPVWLIWAWARLGRRDALRFGAAAAVLAAPWYAKTWLGAGNPVWPWLPGLFGGKWGGPSLVGPLLASSLWTSRPPASELLRYGPLTLILPAAAAGALAAARRRSWPAWLVFLWLPAPVLVAAVWRHHEGWRFLMPLYPAFAGTIAWQARELAALGAGGRAAALALALAAAWPAAAASQNNELFAVLGLRSRARPDAPPRELYLERTLDHYAAFREFSRALPPRSRVLLFREIRGYYLDADYMWGDPVNQKVIDYSSLPDAEALTRRLDELGITHIIVNEGLGMYAPGKGYYDERTLRLMDQELLAASRLERIDGLALYERRRSD